MKAVIYDMDGLLIDSEPLWRRAEIKAFKEVGLLLTEEDCKETMGYRLNEVVELWFSRQAWKTKSLAEVEERILFLVKELILAEGEALKGVDSSLEFFKNEGLRIALASSSPIMLINAVIDKLKIRDYFEVIHSAQFEKFGKPHPSVFITTANEMGISPEDCLVLEDSFHGVIAGLAAKMKVVAIPDESGQLDPRFRASHQVLQSLEEVEKIKHLIEA